MKVLDSVQQVGHKTQLSILTGEVSSLTDILSNCVTGMRCDGKTEDSTLFFSVLVGNKYSLQDTIRTSTLGRANSYKYLRNLSQP